MPKLAEEFILRGTGALPDGWRVLRLKDVAQFTKRPRNLDLGDGHIPFVPMEMIPIGNAEITNYTLKSTEEIRSGVFCEEGDLLLPRITPSFENGKQGIVGKIPSPFAFATTEVYPLRARDNELDQLFLYYFFLQPRVRQDIAGKMEGTTGRQRIPKPVIEEYPISLPPLPEQKKITAVLSAVQEAKEKTEAVIDATKELKKSLMKHLFTHGPVSLEEAEKVPLKKTEIGLMPEEWDVVHLGDIFNTQQGKAMSPKSRRGISPRPFLRTANVLWGRLDLSALDCMDFTNEEMEKLDLQDGDLLVCEGGQVGRTAMWQGEIESCSYQNHIHRLRSKREDVWPEFFMYWMHTAYTVFDLYTGREIRTTIPNLSSGRLKSFAVPFPRLSVQKSAADILSALDRRIEAEEGKKKALEQLFKCLLNNLMTAKIRVSHLEIDV